MRYRYITWGWIGDHKVIMFGKHLTHEVVDEEGKLALFVKERVEKLPYPMTPEEVVDWLKRRVAHETKRGLGEAQ